MCEAHTLPPDLTPAEAAAVDAARRSAEGRAALVVRVRREIARHRRRGHSLAQALDFVHADPALPVSAWQAEDIHYARRGWALDTT